jgi:hypothetical protein
VQKLDELTLQIIIDRSDYHAGNPTAVFVEILINNEMVAPANEYPADIKGLYDATFNSGDYYFWTCFCGVPGCSSIWVPIKVVHQADVMICSTIDLPFLQNTQWVFNKTNVQHTIQECIKDLNTILSKMVSENEQYEFSPEAGLTGINKLLDKGLV